MIVLDTHVWLWWVNGDERLPSSGRRHIEEFSIQQGLVLSSISAWEIFVLEQKKRLRFAESAEAWLRRVELNPLFRFVPVDNRIAQMAIQLPQHHADPADRIILATAQALRLPLLSYDSKFELYTTISLLR
jgi:PIN domain nuclease of toxin-antitoxin system